MFSKCAVALTFLVAISLAAHLTPESESDSAVHVEKRAINWTNATAPGSHHLIAGKRVLYDRLVYKQSVVKSSSWFQKVTRTVNLTTAAEITQVVALDQTPDGKGGYASILSGGPLSKFLSIKFKSQRGGPINFTLEVYGR